VDEGLEDVGDSGWVITSYFAARSANVGLAGGSSLAAFADSCATGGFGGGCATGGVVGGSAIGGFAGKLVAQDASNGRDATISIPDSFRMSGLSVTQCGWISEMRPMQVPTRVFIVAMSSRLSAPGT
jgi:hypothetical protein